MSDTASGKPAKQKSKPILPDGGAWEHRREGPVRRRHAGHRSARSTHALTRLGIATQDKSDATKLEGKLDDMVKKSLEKYPPKQK